MKMRDNFYTLCLYACVPLCLWGYVGYAVDVTATTETNEHVFVFSGGMYPYQLRLWEGPVGKNIYRGLGLRHAGLKPNAWYMNNFIDVTINKKKVLGEPAGNKKYPLLYERCEVLETGGRALVQYIWDREEAKVRLRFLVKPDCSPLLAELAIESKAAVETLVVVGSCFPGKYTSAGDGERRMKTAVREEKAVTNVELNVQSENWMLFYDQKYDLADPIYKRFADNGCAALYINPEGVEKADVQLTGYPISFTITAKPGATRLRMAFDEIGKPHAEALKLVESNAPAVLNLLREETFQPASLTAFDAGQERRKIAKLGATGCSCNRRLLAINEALKKADEAIGEYRQNRLSKPVSSERAAMTALENYQRKLLTAQCRAERGIRVFEMRGPGYSKYRVSQAMEKADDRKGKIDGGYLSRNWQGHKLIPFPNTIEDMYQYDVFLMLDVDTRALGRETLQMFRNYVEDGGGLIVFGGFFSYAAGNIKETPLADILPVKIVQEPPDFKALPAGIVLKKTSRSDFLKRVPWNDCLISPWCHELVPVKEAKVLVMNGEIPWLIIRSAGQGRVAACAGTLFGESDGKRKLYYEWEGWPEVMWKMIKWAAGKN